MISRGRAACHHFRFRQKEGQDFLIFELMLLSDHQILELTITFANISASVEHFVLPFLLVHGLQISLVVTMIYLCSICQPGGPVCSCDSSFAFLKRILLH